MIADRLRRALVCAVALVIPIVLAPAALAVPGSLREGLHAYDETGAVLSPGVAGSIDEEGRAALDESDVLLVAYAAERGDPVALADDVARSWRLPDDAVVIAVVRDPPGLDVRPAGRLDGPTAAAIEARSAADVAVGRLGPAALRAARGARLAVRSADVAAAERSRLGLENTVLGSAVLLAFSVAAAVVLAARAGAGVQQGMRPPGLGAATLGRLADPLAPSERLHEAERLEAAGGGPPAGPPPVGRVARVLAGIVAALAAFAAALAQARDATPAAVLVLLAAGVLGAGVLLLAARAADREDADLHARLYAAHLAESPGARAHAPEADLVALGLANLPEGGEEDGSHDG